MQNAWSGNIEIIRKLKSAIVVAILQMWSYFWKNIFE